MNRQHSKTLRANSSQGGFEFPPRPHLQEGEPLGHFNESFRFASFSGGELLSAILLVEQRLQALLYAFWQVKLRQCSRHGHLQCTGHGGRFAGTAGRGEGKLFGTLRARGVSLAGLETQHPPTKKPPTRPLGDYRGRGVVSFLICSYLLFSVRPRGSQGLTL